ncbi:MAG: hypothetical protein L3J12_08155, partial [Spirochaetales bacterium]|nr:hypothetical protein [Spirochaetales bacterium]
GRNPILSYHDVNKVWADPGLQVVTVHNAGITQVEEDTIMLFRSHLRCGISVLGVARSKNGLNNWQIDPKPFMKPATKNDSFDDKVNSEALIENESGGVEDPRITKIDNKYIITYSAYHQSIKNRVRVSLATTKDFSSVKRFGPMLDQDMRNVVIFPEKAKGKYVALFRPNDSTEGDTGGIYTQIRLGFSENLEHGKWQISSDPIMKTGGGPSAFTDKIGPGAPPIRTKKGWLNIFHGVRSTMDGNPYVLGVALHDLSDPSSVKVSSIPILFPSQADCQVKSSDYIHVPNVVFSCGGIRRDDGSILIYYAGNDTVMNVSITHEDVLTGLCENYEQDPITGKLLYM